VTEESASDKPKNLPSELVARGNPRSSSRSIFPNSDRTHPSENTGVDRSGELPHPTALGATRPSLVEGGASCFCVGTCIRGGHSGSRLRGRLPFTGGSECPTPTGWTLGHNRHCALLVALEQCRRRGERHTTTFDHVGSKAWPRSESYPMTPLYPIPTALLVRLRGLRCSLREGA
jgi:hypothetical protein